MNKIACYFLPAFAMLAIALLASNGLLGKTTEENAEYVVFGLYMLYPILFLYQGFAVALKGYSFVHAIVISAIAFFAMELLLKLHNYEFIIYYLLIFFVGFTITKVVRRRK